MDYQWTNRSPVKPAWAAGGDEPSTPRKRMWYISSYGVANIVVITSTRFA